MKIGNANMIIVQVRNCRKSKNTHEIQKFRNTKKKKKKKEIEFRRATWTKQVDETNWLGRKRGFRCFCLQSANGLNEQGDPGSYRFSTLAVLIDERESR